MRYFEYLVLLCLPVLGYGLDVEIGDIWGTLNRKLGKKVKKNIGGYLL